jgi:hypothetical protein
MMQMKLVFPIVKHVYKGHAREPGNVPFHEQEPFIYRMKLYALLINWEK